jgi:hypothetical protein
MHAGWKIIAPLRLRLPLRLPLQMLLRLTLLLSLCVPTSVQAETTIVGKVSEEAREKISQTIQAVIDQTSGSGAEPSFKGIAATLDGKKALVELWQACRFQSLDMDFSGRVMSVKGMKGEPRLFEVRGFSVKSEGRDEADELVFTFSPSGKLMDAKMAIAAEQVVSLLQGVGNDLGDLRRRQLILEFLENYRTAYVRKDLDYIGSVMSDKALIITGRVLKEKDTEGVGSSKRVEYVRHNKATYMANLQRLFSGNAAIRVEFDAIELRQHPDPKRSEWYGVKLIQHWTSLQGGKTSYSDKGYLFLMVDMANENEPVIWVRSWQPEEGVTTEAEKIGLGDFPIR